VLADERLNFSCAIRDAAAELVKHNVDVIVTLSTTAARPAKQATNVIPIVAIAMADGWWRVLLGQAGLLQGRPFLARS